ncbi:MAG TPA: DUF58 domain-containing protein [Gaiellaceae bacterium]|nr:DUF58 domain-containing protein [Gaiellaceae bacterium]
MTATFPLIPRRRVLGLAFGGLHSIRRGAGSDVAASRPYRPGDDVGKIDWPASARLSLARGSDEFVVREHFAEEAPRVVVLCDRRPSMGVFGEPWPWLDKAEAIRQSVRLIGDSAVAARGLLGYFDEAEAIAFWHPPRSEGELGLLDLNRPFHAPGDTVARGLWHLIEHPRDLPAGTFVFVLSDFLAEPERDDWLWALERRWEVVPVVIQDPVWEQSFPDVAGLVVPFAPPADDGGGRLVRLSASEVERRRIGNEERRRELLQRLRALDLEPVLVSSHEHRDVLYSFLTWADQRLFTRGRA